MSALRYKLHPLLAISMLARTIHVSSFTDSLEHLAFACLNCIADGRVHSIENREESAVNNPSHGHKWVALDRTSQQTIGSQYAAAVADVQSLHSVQLAVVGRLLEYLLG